MSFYFHRIQILSAKIDKKRCYIGTSEDIMHWILDSNKKSKRLILVLLQFDWWNPLARAWKGPFARALWKRLVSRHSALFTTETQLFYFILWAHWYFMASFRVTIKLWLIVSKKDKISLQGYSKLHYCCKTKFSA